MSLPAVVRRTAGEVMRSWAHSPRHRTSLYRHNGGLFYSMSGNREREYLRQVDRHIAECKSHIAYQREVIQELVQSGHDSELAVSMLHVLRANLRSLERHRALVIERLEDIKH